MLKNYLKTALRNLLKNKFYSFINIVGLAAGLATCMLIMVYVLDEFSFDKFNTRVDRIYRVNNEIKFGGNYFDVAVTPAIMGSAMVRDFPEVEQYTRLRWYGSFRVKKGNEDIHEDRVGFADSTLFEVFTLPLIAGDARTALKQPRSLVVTETIARKYFNSTDVVGKTMLVNDTANYKITAVIENIPSQSHFNFDFFVPMVEDARNSEDNWLSENWNTYILLRKNADVRQVESKLDQFMEKYTGPELKTAINQDMNDLKRGGGFIRASLTPLADIHLHSNKVAELDSNGNAEFVYIFLVISILILIIACVNFMNLSTARSAGRAREVGIRKVLGSLRLDLIRQFLIESTLISLFAMSFALVIAWLLLPYFNTLTGKVMHSSVLFQPRMLLSLLLLVAIVGLLAGSYPAFFLSSFQPIEVLKGKLSTGFKRSWLRNALVVFQFAISIVLIFATVVIYSQLNFIHRKDVGFDRNQVLTLHRTQALGDQIGAFRNELLQISGVQDATMSGYLPVNFNRSNDAFFTSPTMDAKTAISLQTWFVDEHYIPTLGIRMAQGRNFSPQFPSDSNALLINEAAAKFLGSGDMLNKKLYNLQDIHSKALNAYHVIGVFKNFNFSSLRDVVTPLALFMGKSNSDISARISRKDIASILDQIKTRWKSMAPGQPFDYSFMDEDFNKLYLTEQRTGQIFITFAALAILIACLGLFGLVTYAAEQRTREIGIRKVLGANTGNIMTLISNDFLKLVLIASVIAFPLSWWAMHKWLEDFAYRVVITWQVFLIAGILALLIAMLSVSYQALKAALANPVNSLRID